MKKTVAFALSVLIAFICFSHGTSAAQTYEWYCQRNKEHRQPTLDANMRFIEDHDGIYVDKSHSQTDEDKVIYLTFDAGYENGNVERILDVLKEKDVNGAFFILTHLVVNDTELVKRMADEGHLVCNHTSKHPNVTKKQTFEDFAAELGELEDIYYEYTGYKISKYFRPPEGKFDQKTLEYAQKLGYRTVFWSFAYADWDNNQQMSHEAAKKKIFDNIHNGAIMLLHPTSSTNAEILGEVIDTLRAEGYRFGSLDEIPRSFS